MTRTVVRGVTPGALLGVLGLFALAACDGTAARGTSAAVKGDPAATPSPAPIAKPARLITVGGAQTEIVFALGAGDEVVAVDTSSVFPDAIGTLPKVGYQRLLATEGILALSPTKLIAGSEAGPPAVLEQLRASGVEVVIIDAPISTDGATQRIRQVAKAIGRVDAGEALAAKVKTDVDAELATVARATSKPRALAVYARGAGVLMGAGGDTALGVMLTLAGADNVLADVKGYVPVTAEAVASAAPEVIVVPVRGLDSLGGKSGLLSQPGLATTPAAKHGRVVALDDLLLLGFGPRLAEGVRGLARGLHPELATGTTP